MSYRGPAARRVGAQQQQIQGHAGEACTIRVYVSAVTASGSAVWAGGGTERYYRETTITGLFASPSLGEARFRETQLPAGQVVAGDVIVSTPTALGLQDEVVWRGVSYRIEGDSVPVTLQHRVWYRTVLRRGDVTG